MNDLYVIKSIFSMSCVACLIRLVPMLLFRKPITNRFAKSFLHYAPFVTLAVMTFPAILETTGNQFTALLGFLFAIILGITGVHFVIVTFGTCLFVFIVQAILV